MARLSESKFEMLTQRVVFDHEILTHRVVARSFKVDTTTAKRLLADFVERSQGRAHATYVVTGYIDAAPPAQAAQGELGQIRALGLANGVVSSSNENSTPSGGPATDANGGDEDAQMAEDGLPPVPSSAPEAGSSSQAYMTELKTKPEAPINEISAVMLVPQEELEEKLALFTRVLSQEVYSVEPSKLPDLVLLTDANAPVLKDKELASVGPDVLGTIKHYRQNVKKDGKSAKASTSSASTSAAALKGKPTDKEKEKDKDKTTKPSASTSKPDLKRKASNVETEAQSKSKSATSSKAASPAVSSAKANDQSSKGKGKETSTSKSSGPSLDDLFRAEVPGKTPPAAQTSKQTSKGSSKKAAEDDDFDDMLVDDEDMMAELDALDKPNDDSKAASDKPKTEKAKTQKPTLQSNRVRKTRKVKKKVVETNAKGFKVTKEVETEEEYTASEESEDEGPVVASTSAASKAAAKQAKDTKAAEKEKAKEKEKEKLQKDKPKEDNKKPPLARSGSSGSMAKKPPPAGQTSLAGFFSKPKPKK